ncbi:MAG TPA: peptidylprolyl isomerase [Vicinamibacterales bacterium]|nr:peptidylprolyl isomerase [Vicinamibacterales bacterium]
MSARQLRITFALAVVAGFFAVAVLADQGRPASKAASAARRTPGAGPVIVVETVKGTFAFETYPDAAPKTVEHVLRLVKRGFYNGQRVQRAVPGFVVQMGDPQTRDMTKKEWWGRGDRAGSGKPVGVAEISKKHLHVKGAVAMAHDGNPANADSQFYITLAAQPKLNGKYAVIGRVIEGGDVPARLRVGDMIKRVSVRPES